MTTTEIVILLGLLILNGFMATARSALVNVRKARLKQLVDEGVGPARLAERLATDARRLLATAQWVMMFTNVFAGALVAAVSTPRLSTLLTPYLGDAAYPVAFVVVVSLTAFVMLILTELVPETLAVQHSERLALWLARPLSVVAVLARPVVQLTVWLGNLVARALGGTSLGGLPLVTEEEIKTLVDAGEEGGVIQEDEKDMIYSIFELGDTLAREVMVPRIDVIGLDVATPMRDALDTIMEVGHSRIPIFAETIDNVIGVLYAKDLLPYLRDGRTDIPLEKLLREAYFIPETKKAGDLLPDLQQRRVHMAIVVDEYGGMAGLVTIEDLLEEIVGEIQDEYDTEEPFVEFVAEDEYILDARVDLDDLNRLMDASLPTEDNDTLGGFIYTELGKVPVVGDHVGFEDLDFAVESVAGRRIRKVRVRRPPVPPNDGGAPPSTPGEGGDRPDLGSDDQEPPEAFPVAGEREGQAGRRGNGSPGRRPNGHGSWWGGHG